MKMKEKKMFTLEFFLKAHRNKRKMKTTTKKMVKIIENCFAITFP